MKALLDREIDNCLEDLRDAHQGGIELPFSALEPERGVSSEALHSEFERQLKVR